MKIIYYDSSSQFQLTDDEFKNALIAFNSGKSIFVKRIQSHLSPFYKWAGAKPDDLNSGRLHDGTKVIKRFGKWTLADDPNVKLDITYYPELLKDEIMTESEWSEKQKTKLLNK